MNLELSAHNKGLSNGRISFLQEQLQQIEKIITFIEEDIGFLFDIEIMDDLDKKSGDEIVDRMSDVLNFLYDARISVYKQVLLGELYLIDKLKEA